MRPLSILTQTHSFLVVTSLRAKIFQHGLKPTSHTPRGSCCGVDKLKDMSLQAPRAQRGLKNSALAMVIDINSTQLSHDDFEADMWAKIASLVPWKEISTRQ